MATCSLRFENPCWLTPAPHSTLVDSVASGLGVGTWRRPGLRVLEKACSEGGQTPDSGAVLYWLSPLGAKITIHFHPTSNPTSVPALPPPPPPHPSWMAESRLSGPESAKEDLAHLLHPAPSQSLGQVTGLCRHFLASGSRERKGLSGCTLLRHFSEGLGKMGEVLLAFLFLPQHVLRVW